jgi:alpha-ketoglutarate-dependent taurine dioxygenase
MGYTITPLSEHTGAEVRGIDLAQPVDETAREGLNRAFVDRSVLVFRDQHLSPHQLLAAVGLFGEIFPQHNSRFALPECPLIHYISNQDFYPDGRRYIPGEGYHTDHSNAAAPPKATVLHAVSLPDRGGDTQYVNMHHAYDELPDAPSRWTEGNPRLSEPPQRAKTDGVELGRPRSGTRCGGTSDRAHPSREWAQGDLHKPDPA